MDAVGDRAHEEACVEREHRVGSIAVRSRRKQRPHSPTIRPQEHERVEQPQPIRDANALLERIPELALVQWLLITQHRAPNAWVFERDRRWAPGRKQLPPSFIGYVE